MSNTTHQRKSPPRPFLRLLAGFFLPIRKLFFQRLFLRVEMAAFLRGKFFQTSFL
ncbi:hypothetical protein [Colidextribacter sp. OB.20]|uniref:hypothetical protein n=1 Tax=Colidextribacter sp. OB.20 TaxID=2304568 RepID=UPI00136A79E3|nr:hypothetical protein [Colidextribacter sp. OB.20]